MIHKRLYSATLARIFAVGVILSGLHTSGQNQKTEAQKEESPACTIVIKDPTPGTPVGGGSTVSGTAKIPTNSHLWILARKKTLNGWWPQGGGETPINDGKWAVDVTYGTEQDRGEFEVAAAAVASNADDDLNKWVATAPERKYPPIKFPAVVEGCPIARVTVAKR
jgi:hypothetical protein